MAGGDGDSGRDDDDDKDDAEEGDGDRDTCGAGDRREYNRDCESYSRAVRNRIIYP